jgi:hypothetical protein
MAKLVTDHANKIAKKLNADFEEGSAHRMAKISFQGKLVATFGIRRGSSKDLGHGHIPKELGLSYHDTLELAECTITAEEYFARLIPGPAPPVKPV